MADAQIKITADTSQAERALGGLSNTLKNLAAISIGSNIAKGLVEIAGSAQELTNKLLSVSKTIDEANAKFYALGSISMKTGSEMAGTVDLFQKLGQSSVFAGQSTDVLAQVVENFNKTLQISGASAEGARSALYNFAQAVQNGTLMGNDFRAMAENNGYFLNILAQKLGISRSELKQWASEGKLGMDIVGQALINNDKITQDYGKTIRTLPQAFNNLQTSFMMTIKALDDSTGASAALVKILGLLASNMDVVIGVATGFFAVFAVGRIAAVAMAIWEIVAAMRAMAVLEAVVSGGLSLVIGAAAGLAAWKLTGDAMEKAVAAQKKLNEASTQGTDLNHERTQAALNVDKQLRLQIASMNEISAIDSRSTGVKSLQLDIERALAAEKAKYVNTNEQMTPQLEKQFRAAERNKILSTEHVAVMKQMVEIQSSMVTNAIVDADKQTIATEMEKFRLSVTKETYDLEKGRLQTLLEQNQAIELQTTYKRMAAPEAQSQVASRAGTIFTGTNEGLTVEAQRQQVALDALKQRGLINDQTYADQEVLINKAKVDAILANEQKAASARLQLNGVTNQAILSAVTDQMAQVKMIQQGGIVGVQGILGSMDAIFSQMGTRNKEAFETHKKLAVAMAMISGFQAAAQSLAIPPGPPFSFIYVATALAATAAQVANIQSQQFSGRAVGGSVMGSTSYIVGEKGPEVFTPASSGMITPNDKLGGKGGSTNINFTIQANDAQGFDQLLNQRKGMITQFVRDAMQESGTRSRM